MKAFPDRRHLLFGRHGHLTELLKKAEISGVTAVAARAKMGKTWLLEELCRRLSVEEGFLVGYFEYKGGGSSHLLYAVGDLYARWLSKAPLTDQFKQRWEEYSENLPSITGKVVSRIKAAFIGLVARSMEQLVREAFDTLSSEILKLKTGGLDLAPSNYDIARDLITFLNKVSGKRISIVLDAWGKSTAMDQEYLALEGFLNHVDSWPSTHIYLGIRDPDESSRIMDLAEKLDRSSRYASTYRLQPMALNEVAEQRRLLQHLRSQAPVTETIENKPLLRLIDSFPGVLDRWIGKLAGDPPKSLEDLEQLADDAQKNRFPEFNWLLNALTKEQRDVVITLSLLPRLNEGTWKIVEERVFTNENLDHFDDLTKLGILEQAMIPSFGHDTRHQWARRWLLENYTIRSRKIGENLIETVAESITDLSLFSWACLNLLYTFRDWIKNLEGKPLPSFCVATAIAAFDGYSSALEPSSGYQGEPNTKEVIFPFLNSFWYSSRGLSKGMGGKYVEAISDFDQALALNPEYADAFSNRGLAKWKQGDGEGAIQDYDRAITLNPEMALAFYNRGVAKSEKGDVEGAIQDFDRAIILNPEYADAFSNRGNAKLEKGDGEGAIQDYDRALALNPEMAPVCSNRGLAKSKQGDMEGAIQDYDRAIALNHEYAPFYGNRGLAKWEQRDVEGAIRDYDRAIALNSEFVDAFGNRGNAKLGQGDAEGAIQDYDQVIALNPEYVHAYFTRGVAKSKKGDVDGAIQDFDRAIALNPEYATAYSNRGTAKLEKGGVVGAIQDFDRAIALNPEYANAYSNRGAAKLKQGDVEEAIQDLDRAIALNPEYATAYSNRAAAKSKQGDVVGAIQDYDQAIAFNPEDATAYYNLSCLFSLKGELPRSLVYLERAFELDEIEKYPKLAETDSDFENVRGEPSFQELLARFRGKQ